MNRLLKYYQGRIPACGVFCGGCPVYTREKKPCPGQKYGQDLIENQHLLKEIGSNNFLTHFNSKINTEKNMKTISFNIQIKASKEKVWDMLWDDSTYRAWTSVFSEGSHVETDWKEGSRILFLNGNGDGMYSVIEKMPLPMIKRLSLLDGLSVLMVVQWVSLSTKNLLKILSGKTRSF